jgi:fatty acid amide hydrolase
MKPFVSAGGELTARSATQLARAIADGTISSEEVVEAHIARIEIVNPQLNAVVAPLFDEARRASRAADDLRRSGAALGPLHGVPVTVKECFQVAGTPSTIGVQRFKLELAAADGIPVARLRAAGAIILGKTNVPQLMLLHETDNPVYGRTNNPWDLERSPGGSSGGEAAVIAAGGSPLGLANDIGGNIRQPAHSCGICGIKPTSGRLTTRGARQALLGMQAMTTQPGFLARTVDDLHLGMAALAPRGDRCEPDEAPVPLGDSTKIDVAQLRIAVADDDRFFSPSPAIRRAVHEAASALRDRGATVEPFVLPDVGRAIRIYLQLISADGGAGFRELLGRSPRDWRIRRLMRMASLPSGVRRAVFAGLVAAGQGRLAELVGWTGRLSAKQYWLLSQQRQTYVAEFHQRLRERKFDALIMPPHALPALKHGASMHLPFAASYCLLVNLLGFPAGVVPITRVRRNEESDKRASRQIVDRAARSVEAGSAGLPVGTQVVSLPWREDKVLAVMAVLETAFSTGFAETGTNSQETD